MALPFLAMGLGLLGGKAFLQSKEDARTADTTIKQAESWLANRPDWAAQNADYLEGLENLRTNQGFFRDDAAVAESFLTNMKADYTEQMNREQQDLDNSLRRRQVLATQTGQGMQIVKPAETRRAAIQQAVMTASEALNSPDFKAEDAWQASLQTIKAVLGDEAVMQGDIDALRAAGGVDLELQSLMERYKMGRLDANEFRRSLGPILERINKGSLEEWNSALGVAQGRAARQGYDIGDVRQYGQGSLQQSPQFDYGQARVGYDPMIYRDTVADPEQLTGDVIQDWLNNAAIRKTARTPDDG